MKPLEGIIVVELSTFVAAPVGARLLADLGATVIKVEAPKGDAWRSSGIGYAAHRFCAEENPIFDIYNTGKQMVCLNLKTQEGMALMHKLLEKADAFVTNNRPAALQRLGLDYETLKQRYPRLVYGIVLGFGEKGPEAETPAFDTTAFWSRTGFMRDMGVDGPEYQPVAPSSGVGDSVAGTNLALQITAALMGREKTGEGQCVRASLYHVGAFAMGTMTIHTQRPFGRTFPATRDSHNIPGGAYKCADGEWIYIGLGNSAVTIPKLYEMIGRPELNDDPRFQRGKRWQNRTEYYTIFKEALLTKTCAQWLELAKKLDIPIVRMQHFADVSEDEQAWANGYVERVEYPNGNADVVPTSPIEMDSVGPIKTQPTRRIGQDTAQVLAELGCSETEIQALADAGAIRV